MIEATPARKISLLLAKQLVIKTAVRLLNEIFNSYGPGRDAFGNHLLDFAFGLRVYQRAIAVAIPNTPEIPNINWRQLEEALMRLHRN